MKTTVMISALAVFSNACAIDSVETDADDSIIESDDGPDGDIRRLSANALMPSELATVTIPVAALTTSYVNTIATTKQGRDSLTYLVGCGLNTGSSITASYVVNGVNYQTTYQGSLGLMTNWKTTTPTQDQQRQISSCVLARLNEFARTLTISLRGNAYTTDSTELSTYTYPEGGFFGNIFSGADNYWGSCDSSGPTHPWRQCSQDTHCSPVVWAGDCATVCTLNANGDFATCTGANSVTYSQPTTTYLSTVTI